MEKIKAAVFASGSGSNFQVIVDDQDLPCEIALLVCDQKDAYVIERAKAAGVEVFTFEAKAYPSKQAYEEEIVELLREKEITWIFFAGYMRLAGETLLQAYEGRIVNIHPSLLPAFPGKDAIGQAFRASVPETGVTIHFVDEGMDTGPVIEQTAVPVLPDDTIETLAQRIHQAEHKLYPKVIKELLQK